MTLVFPAPFPLTLTGAVDLVKNSATFTGLPDIPLTNLSVSLGGGPAGLFLATCQVPAGTATATLTNQNGDKTVTAPAAFSVSGCPAGASGPGGGSGGGALGNASTSSGVTVGTTNLSRGRTSGLGTGHASVSFRLSTTRHAPKLNALIIELPRGLSFVRHRIGKRLAITGVRLLGAQAKSLSLTRGHLLIALRRAVPALTVIIGSSALRESPALKAKAKTVGSLLLTGDRREHARQVDDDPGQDRRRRGLTRRPRRLASRSSAQRQSVETSFESDRR